MEETAVPFLLDLQIMKPRFLFKPKTVQRMEVLVMQTLNWRLRIITPFDFVYCFIARISSCFSDSHQPNRLCHLFSLASDLIINTCIAIDSLDYPPSAIAAAVALWITNHSVDEQNLGHLHNGVNQGTIQLVVDLQDFVSQDHWAVTYGTLALNRLWETKPIYAAKNASIGGSTRFCEPNLSDSRSQHGMVKKIYKVIEGKRSSLKLMPRSPTCVLEAALLCKEIAKYC
ncbi:hypothetical protein GOBAR_DD35362 [Gossypium barbadense]|nr:hypothetical protein GOBAR_DD35362 [Gossypium barbadense]